MTTRLRFGPAQQDAGGRRIRDAHFVKESMFPLTTACIVANGVRERFVAKLGSGISVDLFEPIAVTCGLMDRLLPGAMVFRIESTSHIFWLILRPQTVVGLLSAAFGEPHIAALSALSSLETQTLYAMAKELAVLCSPIYGEITHLAVTHDYMPMYEAASYFEIRIGLSSPIYLGILLACDPDEQGGVGIRPEHLADIALSVRSIAGSCRLTLAELGMLEIGDVLPMIRRESAQLVTGSVILAHGTCGIADGRNAFLVGASGESTKS